MNEATSHDEGPWMVKVALLEPLVAVDDGVEKVELEDRLESMVGADMICDTEDSEDDAGLEELSVADGVGEDGAGLDGVVLFIGVPIIWPLPIKYAGGALYMVGSVR